MGTRMRIWNQILDTDRAVRYFQYQSNKYERRHKWTSWSIVGLALAAAAGMMVEAVVTVPVPLLMPLLVAGLFVLTAGASAWAIVGRDATYAAAAQVYTNEYQRLRQEAIDLWYFENVSSQLVREFERRTISAGSGVVIPIDKELNEISMKEASTVVPTEFAA